MNSDTSPTGRLPRIDPAVRYAIVIFIVSRLFLILWALLVLAIRPLPAEPDERLRPYLDETQLSEGMTGRLLGPWQRFDTMRYLRIARQGYEAEEDSVFPPLYPLAMRGIALLLGNNAPIGTRNLVAAIVVSNAAFFATLVLLYRVTKAELDERSARRSVVYLAIFPTGFFLVAAYTESLFILLALGAIWLARQSRFWQAGALGLLATLARLTGWVLTVPLAYEYMRQRSFKLRKVDPAGLALLLPLVGTLGFLVYRQLSSLPPIDQIYQQYWYQTTAIPGIDLLKAVGRMVNGEAAFTLYFDFICAILLLVTTVATFRRLGPTYGLYSAMLLLFILLPTSEQKPLFSFSRYALAFFPMFMLLGEAGISPWVNRLILYPSIALYLYFSGQFFMWGWVD